MLLAKQAAKMAAIRLIALSIWHIMRSGHSTILVVDSVAAMKNNYLPAEYYLDRGFHYLIPNRDDWNPDTIVLRKSWIYIPTAPN